MILFLSMLMTTIVKFTLLIIDTHTKSNDPPRHKIQPLIHRRTAPPTINMIKHHYIIIIFILDWNFKFLLLFDLVFRYILLLIPIVQFATHAQRRTTLSDRLTSLSKMLPQ